MTIPVSCPYPSGRAGPARVCAALALLALVPGILRAQADTGGVRLRLHIPHAPLVLKEPAVLRAPWFGGPRVPIALVMAQWDSSLAATLDSARAARELAQRLAAIYGRPAGPPVALPAAQPGENNAAGLLGLSPKYANLTLDGQASLEIRTDRTRNERCTPAALLDPSSGCRGSFSPPRLQNQLNLLAGGIIGQRLHINVDYNSERDFTSKNNVQIYYQGLTDEVVQRVEVGTVTFRPPPSRFITAAIPANNFGVNATFEVGRMQFQAIAAQQKGSAVATRTYTIGQQVSTPQDRQVRDLDYESGRFFWVVDPAQIAAYPALDILNLNTTDLPSAQRPKQLQVYRYRTYQSQSGPDPNIGGISAVAVSEDSSQVQGRWQLLVKDVDYYQDPSGFWITTTGKLDQNDYLAVSYTTAAGDSVGTLPTADHPVPAGQAPQDTLRLIIRPQSTASQATFRHEMRQIYRVGGEDLDRSTLVVNLSVNQSERPQQGGASTYLALLGLAVPTDETQFDTQNRLFPRPQDVVASQSVHQEYIVFPNLQPFAEPVLSPAERSDSLYRTPQYLLLTQGPPAKFSFRLRYNSTGTGDRSTLDLNALQLRDGSEHLSVGGLELERGVDYSIDYNLGRVTFLNPDQLFGNGPTTVTARFEERGVFAVAPTTILGGSARYSLGDRGNVNLIGIYQYESTAFNRPPLGFEPTATLVGGVNTNLNFKPAVVTRLLNSLTTGGATAPSRLDVRAELAFTKPDPNRSGAAYLEEFEADAGVNVSLGEAAWEFGSRPSSSAGLVNDIPDFAAGFDSSWAVQLTWQNLVDNGRGQAVELRAQDIDPNIQIVGTGSQRETVMFLTLHADTAGGIVQENNASRWSQPAKPFTPRWRSITTSLSSTGLDLSRNEFLEFWVFQPASHSADSAGVELMLDLGSVNEDALAIAPESLTVNGTDSLYTGRQYVGVGKLDTEREPSGIYNAQTDDIGILSDRPDSLVVNGQVVAQPPLCRQVLSSTVLIYPWGDLSSRCTNGNGLLDTEDLDGDRVLNAAGPAENTFRYLVNLANSKYFVRDGVQTVDSLGRVAGWKLYRIPLRDATDTIGSPNIRLIKQLRITLAAPPDQGGPDVVARLALARMQFTGSQWSRRSDTPIAGIGGTTAQPHGQVLVSVVSTENTELGYTSPPGLGNQVNQKNGGQSVQGTQINERSLRILAQDLRVGERAEAYYRFPSGPQNLLRYRQLRVWMRGRGGGWDNGDLQAYIKLGSDPRNFYLYRTGASTTTWVPELSVDLETWRRLRADVESRFLQGQPPNGATDCGTTDPQAYVACDGPYLVQVGDPGINPPNLASVQEISAGMLRLSQTTVIDTAELWVDDIRVTDPISKVGTALALDTRLTASDVGDLSLSYTRQDGNFQQIGQDPTYRTTGALQLATSWRAERFLPKSLGLTVPVTLSYLRSTVNPDLISGTDIPGSGLVGLRRPENWSLTYGITVRRSRAGTDWLTRGLVDPFTFSASLVRGRTTTEYSNAALSNSSFNLGYNLQMRRHGVGINLGGLVDALPGFLRKTAGAKGARRFTLALAPTSVRLTSGLTRTQSDVSSFLAPVQRASDSSVSAVLNLSHLWRNSASINLQPLTMFNLSGDLTSTRDLRHYADSTTLGRLAQQARKSFLGQDVGVERDRQFSTSLSLTPVLTSWLRPRYLTGSSFILSRTLNSRPPVRLGDDSLGAFILPQTLNNNRSREFGLTLDPGIALSRLLGDSSSLGQALKRIRPFDISNRMVRSSTFDLAAFDPDLSYMLGLGRRENFLRHQGADAIGVGEIRTTTWSSGADLPFGLGFTLTYGRVHTLQFQRVGGSVVVTDTRQREWPVGNFRLTHSFRSGPLSLLSASLSLRRKEGHTDQPSAAGSVVRSGNTSSSVGPSLQLGWRNGLVMLLGYNDISQETQSNGNLTHSQQQDITANLSYSFRLPGSLSRLRKQIRASLYGLLSSNTSCLQSQDSPDCTTIADTRRTEVRGGLDTDVSRILQAGMQFGYSINEARSINSRISQIFIAATLQLSLYAGDYR